MLYIFYIISVYENREEKLIYSSLSQDTYLQKLEYREVRGIKSVWGKLRENPFQ